MEGGGRIGWGWRRIRGWRGDETTGYQATVTTVGPLRVETAMNHWDHYPDLLGGTEPMS